MTVNDIDWSAVEIEPPEPPEWLGTVTAIWMVCGLLGLGSSLLACLAPSMIVVVIPMFAIGLFTFSASLRVINSHRIDPFRSGMVAVVFGLMWLSPSAAFLFSSFAEGGNITSFAIANVYAVPGLAMLGSGWLMLARRSEYQRWQDAKNRCHFVSHAAHEVILSEATERGVALPEGEMHAFSVVPGSIFAKSPQPLSWIALARTGPDGIRTTWRLPVIVGIHDDFPPERLKRTMILTFAQGTDPIFLDGETMTIQRYHVNERRFETIAGSLVEWLNGVGRS